jgi:hypothetical protein
MVEVQINAEFAGCCVHHTQAFRHDLFADTVTGDHCYAVFCH